MMVVAQSFSSDLPATVVQFAWDAKLDRDGRAELCNGLVNAWASKETARGYVSRIAP